MPLPLLFLLVLLIRSSLLKGAGDGIEEYLDFSEWNELKSSGVWDAAVGQCFFSLSVCMGVMTAYGSYNPIRQNIAFDEKVISLLDLFTSLFAGFVVYTVLGHLNHIDPDTDWYSQASFGLVFSAYPVAITELDDAEQLFGVLFFLVLFLLGIDSLFSLVEALTTVIVDSDVGRALGAKHSVVSLATCIAGAGLSSIYCLGSGLYWLDIVDRYINNYGMVFLGWYCFFVFAFFLWKNYVFSVFGCFVSGLLSFICCQIFSVFITFQKQATASEKKIFGD